MAKVRLAINGFGRIGRNAFKIALGRNDVEVVAVNDIADAETLAYLLRHDTNYGEFSTQVGVEGDALVVNGVQVPMTHESQVANLSWRDRDVDVVLECTGAYATAEQAKLHLDAGAKRVVVSAPVDGDDVDTVIIGVNEDKLPNSSQVVSGGSCAANSVAPVMAILEDVFGVQKAMVTTVRSYTTSQRLQDAPAGGMRESRAAAQNIVPTTTMSTRATERAIPALQGKLASLNIRVPSSVVSVSDVVAVLGRDVTVDEVNQAFRDAATKPFYQGIVAVTDEQLVSSDFRGNSHSAIVDLPLTDVVAGNLVKVVAWYDNEWGYSNRLVELAADAGRATRA